MLWFIVSEDLVHDHLAPTHGPNIMTGKACDSLEMVTSWWSGTSEQDIGKS